MCAASVRLGSIGPLAEEKHAVVHKQARRKKMERASFIGPRRAELKKTKGMLHDCRIWYNG